MMNATLLWLRQDLRLADHPALHAALHRGGPVIPVFLWAPDEAGDWPPGGASRWWLHHSLNSLQADLEAAGSRLILRRGPSESALRELCQQTGADAVYWSHRYEPSLTTLDQRVKESLAGAGLEARSWNASLLHEPWTVQNKAGKPFQVFTPYWRHCLSLAEPEAPLPAPRKLPAPARWPSTLDLQELELEPKISWTDGLRQSWQPGSTGAKEQLSGFLHESFDNYGEHRNRPDLPGTSRLSPHLHFGEISPRQVWHGLRRLAQQRHLGERQWRNSQFVAELGWREFSHHLLFHFPHTTREPLHPEFSRFPWRTNAEHLKAWQRGQTGYPLVDAGMRELWNTGWMHNRVRMVAASFLVKDLLISWQEGAAWFWDTLVDADLAQNTLGWQWTAGCGADAAPYFRVFNPASQGEKFDPHGDYVRQWCPELAGLPAEWIHRPHEAPASVLNQARVELGVKYPHPIVSHPIARDVALEAYARIKGSTRPA
ncbi:MAG: DNA photolyase family protein [Verrucomicrobia bacterium]|jgi:deoxyribodipyrimidine photo-lyase|nr:DNA photolyase family protein [Verrucomicrobiota bacterium]